MAQVELIMHKFLNETTLHIHLYDFQIKHKLKQCTIYHDTANHSKYFS